MSLANKFLPTESSSMLISMKSANSFCRRVLLHRKVPRFPIIIHDEREVLWELRSINKVGNNLNQIAQHLNGRRIHAGESGTRHGGLYPGRVRPCIRRHEGGQRQPDGGARAADPRHLIAQISAGKPGMTPFFR